jgi:hypothetical protein
LTLADSAGNSAESGEYSVTVAANTAFKGSGFTAENGAGAESTPDKGDVVAFTFNKKPDPYSIVSGWNGSGTKSVTVSIASNASNDTLSVSGATIGTVALDGDFTASSASFSGSTISLSGSTVTVVLGGGVGKRQIRYEQKQTGLYSLRLGLRPGRQPLFDRDSRRREQLF